MSHIKMLSPALEAQFSSFLAAAPRIVLGSSSSSRRSIMDDLAARFRFKYEVRTADIDEKAIRHAEPAKLVMALGHAKAEAIIAKMTAAGEAPGAGFLLTCDQVVVHEGAGRRCVHVEGNDSTCAGSDHQLLGVHTTSNGCILSKALYLVVFSCFVFTAKRASGMQETSWKSLKVKKRRAASLPATRARLLQRSAQL